MAYETKPKTDFIPGIVAALKNKIKRIPDVGIICGSGLGHLASTVKDAIVVSYSELKGFPESTVQGHEGSFVFGTLGGKYVACMKGRFHFYEGWHPSQVALGVRVMAALGVKALVVTNAAGGVNPSFDIGNLMVIKDQIGIPGIAGNNSLIGPNDDRYGPRFPPMSLAFDAELQDLVFAVAKKSKSKLTLQRGVYFGVSGPAYETPAEIQMIRILGGDSVGMSTILEIIAAAHSGVKVLGLSLITNRCRGPNDNTVPPSHEEVLTNVKAVEGDVQRLVTSVVEEMKLDSWPRPAAYDYFLKNPAAVAEAAMEHNPIAEVVNQVQGEDKKQPGTATAATEGSGCPYKGGHCKGRGFSRPRWILKKFVVPTLAAVGLISLVGQVANAIKSRPVGAGRS